jgi:hypothetical protein
VTRLSAGGWGPALPTDAPMNVPRVTVFATTLAISSDFTHALVVSNKKLTPGALEDATNLYVETIDTGAMELVASTEEPGALGQFTAIASMDEFIAGDADFSKVVFESKVPMIGAAGVSSAAIYAWDEQEGLQVLSTLPDGSIAPAELVYQDSHEQARRTSEGLRRVYFALSNGAGEGVYLNEAGSVRAISTPQVSGGPTTPQPGRVIGTSADGRYAFFIAASEVPLTEDAPPSTLYSVYRYDAVTGQLVYLKASTPDSGRGKTYGVSDDGDTAYFLTRGGPVIWSAGSLRSVPDPGTTYPLSESAYVSSSGRYFEFENEEEIEGFEARLPRTIYLYDRESGQTVCISCRADGTNPRGASLPETETLINAVRPSPLGNDGEALFTTKAALLPADVNGVADVYSYRDGVLRLISPGDAPFPATFADRSADGKNIYFTTAQGLVPQDTDGSMDIYDARRGGVPPTPAIELTRCAGESCAGAAAGPPATTTPASEAVTAAKKKHKHRKAKHKKKSGKHRKKRSAGHPHGSKANHKNNGGKR